MAQTLKERLAANQLVRTFALSRVLHPVLIEMFGQAGRYEGFWIDMEHSALTADHLTTAAIAGRANGLDNFVRIPPVGYWLVTQCLEAGAGGVMAAQIHSAEQAAQFVSWTKFPPEGTRGLNASGRDANYSHMKPAEFVERANRDNFVAIQVETTGALEQVDEIAGLEGVDLLFVGPSDLSMALGVVGQFHHEKLWEAISRVSAACKRHGKHWGAVVPDPEFAQRALDLGCRMPTIGNDVITLRRGIDALQHGFASCFAS